MHDRIVEDQRVVRERDPYRQLLEPVWDLDYEQLEGGAFEARVSATVTPRAIFYRERINRRCRVEGVLKPGLVGFGVSDGSGREQGLWWGGAHPENGIPVAGGDSAELDVILPAGSRRFLVLMDENLFRSHFVVLSGRDPDCFRKGSHFLRLPDRGNRLLWRDLETLQEGRPWSTMESGAFELRLVELLVARSPAEAIGVSLSDSQARGLVNRAIEIAESHRYSLTVAQLCLLLNASKRVLEYAFQGYLGCSPAFYLKCRRLNLCRRHLLAADPGTVSVREIAGALGFLASGRFASLYRDHFGELPSETLGRPAGRKQPGLGRKG